MEELKDAIKFLSKDGSEVNIVLCSVQSVDLTKKVCVCEPISGGADLMGVKLMAKNQIGMFIIPKINSNVIVTIQNDLSYVSYFSEVDEIHLNGENYGGLVRIQELTNKLNALENSHNQHLALYNAHTHPETTVNTLVPATLDTNILTPTIDSELENQYVKHGNG